MCIERLIADQSLTGDASEEGIDAGDVMPLARQKYEGSVSDCRAHRPARQFSWSGRRATCRWPDFESLFCAGSMLMDPNVRRVDQHILKIRIIGQGLEDPLPDAFLRPAPKPCIHAVPFTEVVWQVAPR